MRFSVLRAGLFCATLGVLVGTSSPAAAYDDDEGPSGPTGLEIGLRSGYGIGLPTKSKTTKQIPIWADLGYRATPNLLLGVWFQYGVVICDGCSAHDIRLGAQVHYHFSPDKLWDPWIGLGVGYETLGVSVSLLGRDFDASISGIQYANAELGADYKVDPNLGIGPFVDFSLGKFDGTDELHEWLLVGLRFVYDIPVGGSRSRNDRRSVEREPSKDSTPASTPSSNNPSSSPPPIGPEPKPAAPVTMDASGWPSNVPMSDRGTCSFVCVSTSGPPVREADKNNLGKALDKHLSALRSCVGGGKSAAGVVASFDSRGTGTISYDFGPRATARPDCPGIIPPVKGLSGPSNSTWKCTDYCE